MASEGDVCQMYICADAACSSTRCFDDGSYTTETDARPVWMIMCGAQVFLMQLGFANLEAGSVSRRNVQNILFKNIMDACLGSMVWFCFGYGVAWGTGDFVGENKFFTVGYSETTDWFFQWAFCVTASTIVSGAVAERMKLEAYFIYTLIITAFIYPAVVHWIWSGDGWASAFSSNALNPIVDFAGSGVVHMVGGWSGLMGAYFVGPRPGRFQDFSLKTYKTHSVPLQAFGTFVLWFGWYGFNCGSTVAVVGAMETASLVAVTTTLAAASGGLTASFLGKFLSGKWNIGLACNGVLAGLVSVTAPCAVVQPELSIVIGFIGGLIYYGFSALMIRLEIDDPLDAAAVHGACGFWGVISVGIFATQEYLIKAGYTREAGLGFSELLGNQIAVSVAVTSWTLFTAGLMFFCASKTIGIRTEHGGEDGGLDIVDFGTEAYESAGVVSYESARKVLAGSLNPTAKNIVEVPDTEKLGHNL